MTDVHVSSELLERVARRTVRPDEIVTLAQHLERCTACATRAREHASRDLARLREELAPAPASRARRSWWIAAAAAILAAIAVTLWMARPEAPAPVPVRTETPRPVPAPVATPPAEPREYEPEWKTLVTAARSTGTLPFPPELEELRGSADVVRGGAGERLDVRPAGVVVQERRPAFTWPAREAGRYVVYVYDGEREIVRSGELHRRTWRPQRALPRGRTLSWQVEVIDGNDIETIPRPPAPPARFRIAAEDELRDIERARTLHPNDTLLHAVLYARAGLRDEALASLRRAPADDVTNKLLDRYVNQP